MKSYLKRIKEYFIPEKDNDYTPHFFGTASILFFAAVIVVVFVITSLQFRALSTGNYAAIVTSVLTNLTNNDRLTQGLGWLTTNETLAIAAQMKANDMAANGYFAHTSPDGKSPWHWFKQAGYKFSYAGENLAVNFSDSIDVEKAWMNSPTHRANIVNGHYTEIGIATAQGVYNGRPTTFVVQLFGRPAVATTSALATKPKEVRAGTSTLPRAEVASAQAVSHIASTTPTALALHSKILGENLEVITEDDTFVAVRSAEGAGPEDLIAAAPTTSAAPSFFEHLFASPKTLLTWVYFIVMVVVVVALIIDVVVEIRRQHPMHIVSATLLLLLIFILIYASRATLFPALLIL